jgi:predicted transcriptional regulator
MSEMRLGMVESHFADIVWKHAPLTTRELTILCEKELNWKRTTTYTVLKKMCNRGIFRTENSVVSVLISKEEFSSMQSEQFVEDNFCGSLPAFIAAFTARRAPTEKELAQIKEMLASYEEHNR